MANNWQVSFNWNDPSDEIVASITKTSSEYYDVSMDNVTVKATVSLDEAFEVAEKHISFLKAKTELADDIQDEIYELENDLDAIDNFESRFTINHYIEDLNEELINELEILNEQLDILNDITFDEFFSEELKDEDCNNDSTEDHSDIPAVLTELFDKDGNFVGEFDLNDSY